MKIRWNKKILVAVPILVSILIIIIFMNNGYGNYLTLENEMGIYRLAEEKLTNGWDEAKDVCSRLKNDRKISECYYNLIIPFLKNIDHQAFKYNLGQLKKTCEGMLDNSWKGECYFILADYSVHIDINEAIELCGKSKNAFNYPCFNHVLLQKDISVEEGFRFCQEAPDQYQGECYLGLAYFIGEKSEDMQLAMEGCKKLKRQYKKVCYYNVGASIGYKFKENVSKVNEMCKNIEDEYIEVCFAGIGHSIYYNNPNELNNILSEINQIESKYQLNSLISAFNQIEGKSNIELNQCKNLEGPSRHLCYITFINNLKYGVLGSIKEIYLNCRQLNNSYNSICLRILTNDFGNEILVSHKNKNSCLDFNELEIKYCFEGLGNSGQDVNGRLLPLNKDAILNKIDICEDLDEKYKKFCFKGTGRFIGSNLLYNISFDSTFCNLIEKKYWSDCFEGVGSALYHNLEFSFIDSIESVCNDKCSKIDGSYILDCYLGCWKEVGLVSPLFLERHCTTLENETFKKECFNIWENTIA